MTEWNWLSLVSVLAIHDQQLARHGGLPGVRDSTLLESALARPQNLAAYGEPDVCELAASYAFGIARNHPFVDGNKRTAFVAAMLFFDKNSSPPVIPEVDVVMTIQRLAAGELSEAELAGWFRSNIPSGLHEDAAVYRPARKPKAKKRIAKKVVSKRKPKRKR